MRKFRVRAGAMVLAGCVTLLCMQTTAVKKGENTQRVDLWHESQTYEFEKPKEVEKKKRR
jgi:hypothetical protein